ncbi:MAG: phage tail sheath family protein, partial [Acidimicrobiales bacterium]
ADSFNLVVKVKGKPEETFDGLTTKKGKGNAVQTVNAQSKLIKLEEAVSGGAVERPGKGSSSLAGGAAGSAAPARLEPQDYVGDSANRTGFGGLEAIEDITMLSVPDLTAALEQGLINLEGFKAVQLAMIAHCELMGDRMAILDPPPNLNAQQIKDWRVEGAGYDSKYAALYWPRIKVLDPLSGQNIFVPPSGHMAGIWARNDNERGVHKAPANEVIRGAVSLELNITKGEHDLLNPVAVNAIRAFPGRGIRVWGGRTLSSDPAWKYINVRRLFNYLEKSIQMATDWVVFEPNDRNLWAKVRRTIAGFLVMEWRKGALFGNTPDEAFYVQCDDETNPAEGIDAGQVVCNIGVAPVKPAEFIIFRLSQFSGGVSLVSE